MELETADTLENLDTVDFNTSDFEADDSPKLTVYVIILPLHSMLHVSFH